MPYFKALFGLFKKLKFSLRLACNNSLSLIIKKLIFNYVTWESNQLANFWNSLDGSRQRKFYVTIVWPACIWMFSKYNIVRINFSNTRCWFGWSFFIFFPSQVVITGTSFNILGKTRVSAYKGDTADDISKPSIFLCRHRTISTSESRLTTYYSSHILSKHLRVVYAVTKSISSLIFISLRLRSARTETRSTI